MAQALADALSPAELQQDDALTFEHIESFNILCVGESGLYERLAWLAAARNLYSHLPSNQYAHGTSFVRAEMEGKAKAKAL